ncbi:breast cancer metastasis-suppressor 1 [Monodelphis domestica]|uniref:breast cancer metastasis-suppressor 1 n=1 Tax=Monodelphis domestica TaxID=13616 RepID=UPI0024E1B411|nr:breast cancer metastasis-suppressor 1 [Monodelphis domestica]XP_056657275.1 breast cancer metastasis-suppressor 1 [Monodelphis domestica]
MPLGKEGRDAEGEGDGGDPDSAPEMNGLEEEGSEDEQTGSQTESDGESSEMDDEDCERRRVECLDEMSDLEKQFSELKEKLFKERLSQVRLRLEEVGAERAPEYTEPLGGLQRSLKIRIQVAGIYKGFCLDVIRNKYECELQGARQHLESERLLLYDALQGELQERIQRLEEDRQSVDINSEWWDDKLHPKGNSKSWESLQTGKRKKAPLVSGPYIVYMLEDVDILEDWAAIKKAKVAVSPQKRKADEGPPSPLRSPPAWGSSHPPLKGTRPAAQVGLATPDLLSSSP